MLKLALRFQTDIRANRILVGLAMLQKAYNVDGNALGRVDVYFEAVAKKYTM